MIVPAVAVLAPRWPPLIFQITTAGRMASQKTEPENGTGFIKAE